MWHHGIYSGARFVPSEHYSPRTAAVSLIVLHNISLPPFEYGSDDVERLFSGSISDHHPDDFIRSLKGLRVASHFFIRRSGEVVQFVSTEQAAFHAGVSVFRGQSGCNAFSVGIELEGCDFEPFENIQYEQLLVLLRDLAVLYPDAPVCGHEHIAPGRKTDPGIFFDWQRLADAGIAVAPEVFQAA